MKKIIGLLASTSLIVGAGATAVSCENNSKVEAKQEDKASFKEFFKELKVELEKDQLTPQGVKAFFGVFLKEHANVEKWKDHKFIRVKSIMTWSEFEEREELLKIKEDEVMFVVWDNQTESKKVTIEGFIGVKKNNKVETKRIDAITLPFINEKNPIIDISNNLNLIKLEIFENWEKNDVSLKINEAMKKINYKLEEDKHYRIDFSQALNQEGKTIAGRQVLISAINNELIKGKFKITIRSMNI